MVRSEGNTSLKNPVPPPEIDPGTVRQVLQRLNHYATPGPVHMHAQYPTMNTTKNRYDTTPHDSLPCVVGKHHMQS
jgi:hypothetical protein